MQNKLINNSLSILNEDELMLLLMATVKDMLNANDFVKINILYKHLCEIIERIYNIAKHKPFVKNYYNLKPILDDILNEIKNSNDREELNNLYERIQYILKELDESNLYDSDEYDEIYINASDTFKLKLDSISNHIDTINKDIFAYLRDNENIGILCSEDMQFNNFYDLINTCPFTEYFNMFLQEVFGQIEEESFEGVIANVSAFVKYDIMLLLLERMTITKDNKLSKIKTVTNSDCINSKFIKDFVRKYKLEEELYITELNIQFEILPFYLVAFYIVNYNNKSIKYKTDNNTAYKLINKQKLKMIKEQYHLPYVVRLIAHMFEHMENIKNFVYKNKINIPLSLYLINKYIEIPDVVYFCEHLNKVVNFHNNCMEDIGWEKMDSKGNKVNSYIDYDDFVISKSCCSKLIKINAMLTKWYIFSLMPNNVKCKSTKTHNYLNESKISKVYNNTEECNMSSIKLMMDDGYITLFNNLVSQESDRIYNKIKDLSDDKLIDLYSSMCDALSKIDLSAHFDNLLKVCEENDIKINRRYKSMYDAVYNHYKTI